MSIRILHPVLKKINTAEEKLLVVILPTFKYFSNHCVRFSLEFGIFKKIHPLATLEYQDRQFHLCHTQKEPFCGIS
jgi:hypothetical protein